MSRRPNVLIIYTDQQRFDSLGCYGNNKAKTPHLDQLAKEGVLLNNYFVQNPVCMPSRMSFLTGRYPANIGIGCNGTPLPEDTITINQLLKPYGYHSGNLGKLHFQPHAKRDYMNPHPLYGFDNLILSDEPGCYDDAYSKWVEDNGGDVSKVRTSLPPEAMFYGKPEYSRTPRETHEPYIFEEDDKYSHSGFVTAETCNYIDRHKNDTFMCIAGFYAPHTPVNPPKRFVDLYDDTIFDLPKLGEEEYDELLKDVPKEQWLKTIKYYMAFVSQVDECVGTIVQSLKNNKIFDNTIIVFTSDHGEYLGDHGRIQKGMPGHDCIIKVPCIISYPNKIKDNKVIENLVEAVDIVPTLLDWCGVQKPEFVQGKSIRGLIDGGTDIHKSSVLVDYFEPIPYGDEIGISRSTTVRTKDFMYNLSDDNEFLYDLNKDKYQLKNEIDNEAYKNDLLVMRRELIRRLQLSGYIQRNRPVSY